MEEHDRISLFHDSILHHMLYFLAAEDAIKTSVLSRRWNGLWKFAPGLSFCNRRGLPRVSDFAALVCTTLDLYSSSGKLIKLLIDFEYTGRYFFYVDKWVYIATTHNVENLYLEFYATKAKKPNTSDSTSYLLPPSLCTNSMLKTLSLTFCSFETITTISWTSLKVLWIGYATLTHDMIHNILLGSPALTELRLHNFEFEGNEVVINSTRLKKLELEGDKDPAINDFTIVEISAPNLQSLSIPGFIYYSKFELTNVSSLIEARLSFERKSTYNGRLLCYLNELSVLLN